MQDNKYSKIFGSVLASWWFFSQFKMNYRFSLKTNNNWNQGVFSWLEMIGKCKNLSCDNAAVTF